MYNDTWGSQPHHGTQTDMPEALASLPQEHAEELLERLDKTVVLETVLLHCFGGYF